MSSKNNKSSIINHQLSLTIGWLYPELMSTYGDRGNIITLSKRCEWRGIKTDIKMLDIGYKTSNLAECDILFMGGAQDKQQSIVAKDFSKEKRKILRDLVDNGTPGLYICGAYQFLGKYYKEATGNKIPGLGILDLYTEHPGESHKRLIGNTIIEINDERLKINEKNYQSLTLVGFENHGGRTYLGKGLNPLGKVLKGYGNNGEDGSEGAIYKNSIGSYLHGPILPKNPNLADHLIKLALEKKYHSPIILSPLDDSLEIKAHEFIAKRD